MSEALFQQAVGFHKRGNLAEAEKLYQEILAADPSAFAPRHMLGVIRGQQGRNEEALELIGGALKSRPDALIGWMNYANILSEVGRREDALASYDKAVALKPDYGAALTQRGLILHDLRRLDEALESFGRAIAADPGNAEAHWNKSLCHLLVQDFSAGWRDYGWHKKLSPPIEARVYPQPCWSGAEDIAGKTLFLYAGQGLGDTIQFYRYASLAVARGAKVVLSAQDNLRRLLQSGDPAIELIDAEAVPPHFDLHVALIDLPQAFASDLFTIPTAISYLKPETQRVMAWKEKIGAQGFRIGICWQGKDRTLMGSRSFPPDVFVGLSRVPGVRLISLQKVPEIASGANLEILNGLDDGPDAFIDTAAAMESLDLIVTADTSVAHLAGALGRPTWMALKYVPDWRWFLDRSDSPWYPSMRLFRQDRDGDWTGVFAQMESELVALAGQR